MMSANRGLSWWLRGVPDASPLASWAATLPEAERDGGEAQAVVALAVKGGERRPDVLTALWLAARAPRLGHVCADLGSQDLASFVGEEDLASLSLPADRDAWVARVEASSLVGTEGCPTERTRPWVLHGRRLYPAREHRFERSLALQLRDRGSSWIEPSDPALLQAGLEALFPAGAAPDGSVDRQRLAGAVAATRRLCVVSGGPGTGKTHTVRAILALLYAQWVARGPDRPAPQIALAAPTGKAAARVVESLRSGLHAQRDAIEAAMPPGVDAASILDQMAALRPWTLHRLLGWLPGATPRFRHHAEHPLPFDIVVVDEASMVDAAMMSRLFEALDPDARVILLGDRHQLASVEAGTVLADVCGAGRVQPERVFCSGVAARRLRALGSLVGSDPVDEAAREGIWDGVVFLRHSRRYPPESELGQLAHACVRGDVARVLTLLDQGREVRAETSGRPEVVWVNAALSSWRDAYAALKEGEGVGETRAAWCRRVLRMFERFRILASHRLGPRGVEAINRRVERALAREGWIDPRAGHWYVGRPILVTRNDRATGRFNGDVGMIMPADSGAGVVAVFPVGDREVEEMAPVRLPDHESVYAMTIHKSQGSEHDEVMVVLPGEPSPLLTRELIYTGVTRARVGVTVVGSPEVLTSGLQATVRRATGLGDRLWSDGP